MIRIVNGKPVQVTDDERITPELKAIRSAANDFLRWLQSPEAEKVSRQYYDGIMSVADLPGFDWFGPTDENPASVDTASREPPDRVRTP